MRSGRSLPRSFGNLTSLGVLQLGNNRFTGSIPASWDGIASSLSRLDLSGNQLTGARPRASPLLCSAPVSSATAMLFYEVGC